MPDADDSTVPPAGPDLEVAAGHRRSRLAGWQAWILIAAIVAAALYLNLQLLGDS